MVKNPYRFYTYAYLREDRTPYYIGKGSGRRIYDKNGRPCGKPKDKSRIIFLKQNLTEEEAFKHEIYMISVFGRKDLGTGILHNKTDGGDGVSGVIVSEETREKLRKSSTKYNNEGQRKLANKKTHKNYYLKNKEKISRYYKEKYKKMSSDLEWMENQRLKQRIPKENQKTNRLWKTWKITFSDGRILEMTGLYNWCKNNGYSDGLVYQVAKGTRNKHKDIVSVEQLTTYS
jgi:hypothetical protein